MVQQTMYPAQPDSPDFELAANITTTGQTAIVFLDLTGLLAAPNTITIRQDDTDTTPETMYYSADPVGTTLTVTRAYGGTVAKTFTAGARGCRAHTALDHNTIRANILDLVSIIPVVPAFETVATNIKMNGVRALGSSGNVPDSDHVHPVDTSRQAALTNPVVGLTASFVSGDVITGTGTGDQVRDSGVLLTALATTSNKIDGFAVCGTTDTTKDANTTNHGLLLKAVAPSAGFMRFVGIAFGETAYALKELFDATTPPMDGSASAGTAVTAARIDHIHPTDTSRAAATALGSWGAFNPSPTWGTADPTITTTVARYARTGNTVAFAVSFVISNGNAASSLTMALPVAAPQTAGYQIPLIAFKKITTGGSSIMSDPFAYIDYTEATPVIKFNQFGTLPSGYTAVLNISGSYEVA